MTEQTWNPTTPNQQVRLRRNPGKRGVTTGQTKESAGRLLVLVNFGPNEKTYKSYDQLEPCGEPEEIRDLLEAGRFGNPDDLRRILTFEKVKGHLTNIFYSMESSNTDFYAYQFKPVLKFLDSPVGRLLIADEVGLGKTIESMYIWKELQAREDARRLLIVCPAMLRDKWLTDLKKRFNFDAKIIDAKDLLEATQSILQRGNSQPFIYITSLEGLRIKKWDEDIKGTRAELARLLYDNQANTEFSIFDLVIIDEAHYLRNPETANNKLAELLRDASRHLVLLTATPIQIRSNNLYQLLKLISPEDFFDPSTFERMLEANKPVVEALRMIWKNPPDISATQQSVEKARQSYYFSKSLRIKQVSEELANSNTIEPANQVRLAQFLESSSLFGQFMTRSRKREVMEKRVKRTAQTLQVEFTLQEKQVYDYITNKIRFESIGKQKFDIFRLLARQRQMTSCMVAALKAWKKNGVIHDFLAGDDDELLYELFGYELNNESTTIFNNLGTNIKRATSNCPIPEDDSEFQIFIDNFQKNDTKYKQLITFLQRELRNKPQEKFVLFAFYRGTLTYLQKRLTADEINNCLIIGGMDRQDKQVILAEFQNNNTCSLLLSSEVGSEGIDLQFCRFVINYDLPWNPMRVEQRIGRLDRLGQKANKISIINFSLKDTIEEYILEKLYSRIKIFEESIGDLEEILGEKTEALIFEFLNPKLNEKELILQAEQTITAIANELQQQRKLENEAINLVAFSDYILSHINTSRRQGRWLRPEELKAFVEDFFKLQYPGTVITPARNQQGLFDIKLSDEAKVDLKMFCTQRRFSTPTRLYNQAVSCFFDPKIAGAIGKFNHELLDPTHPLIQWIRQKYEPESRSEEGAQNLQTVSACRISNQEVGVESGIYVYVIHRWELSGLRKENRLAYKVVKLGDSNSLPDEVAEALVNQTALCGQQRPNANNLVELEQVLNNYDKCEELLQEAFADAEAEFEAENTDRCNVQESSARAYVKRKKEEYEERIKRFIAEGKLTIIRADEGRIKKAQQDLNIALKNIELKRQITTCNPALAAGIIFIE
ncbi:SNF2-related protein [Nostoc sp.]|uniref:SNF2-related protein n=1 Tax=Nostoc sp. TaxID=1180 RepID=UPI002FFA6967